MIGFPSVIRCTCNSCTFSGTLPGVTATNHSGVVYHQLSIRSVQLVHGVGKITRHPQHINSHLPLNVYIYCMRCVGWTDVRSTSQVTESLYASCLPICATIYIYTCEVKLELICVHFVETIFVCIMNVLCVGGSLLWELDLLFHSSGENNQIQSNKVIKRSKHTL